MPEQSQDQSQEQAPPIRKRAWLRRTLIGLACVLALLAAAVLALPPLASSDWARARAERTLSTATGKPASLRRLSFGWRDGLRVEGLRIGNGGIEDDGFLCSLERLHVDVGFLAALRSDFRLKMLLSGLRLRLRLEPGAKQAAPKPEPPAKPLPEALRDGLAALRQALKPGPRKADAHLDVDLSDIAVRLDQAGESGETIRRIDLRDASLRLKAPGLGNGPVRLDAGLDILVDGRRLAPVKVAASLDGLLDKTGQMAPAQARLDARAELSGLHLIALGSVAKGFKTDLRLDLRQLTALLKPLAGADVPEAAGQLALGLTAAQPDPDHLVLGLVAFADGLGASGGALGGKPFGPLRLNLLQEANFDLAAGTMRLPGTLNLLADSSVRWQGEATGLNGGRPQFSLNVKPLHLQLDELAGMAKAWLPPGLDIGPTSLDAESIGLLAALPDKPGQRTQLEAVITGLTLEARNIVRKTSNSRLGLARARLRLDSLKAALPAEGPGSVETGIQADLEGLRMQGGTTLALRRARLSRLTARLDGFAPDPAALFGLTGTAEAVLDAGAEGLDIPGKARVNALTSALTLHATLPATKSATARLDSLALDITRAALLQPGKRPVEFPLTLRLAAPDIRLAGPAPFKLGFNDATLDMDLGQALRCAATASLDGGSLDGGNVRGNGGLNLDLRRVFALAAPLLPAQAKGSGSASLEWKLAASLPPPQPPGPKTAAAPKPEKLSQTLARLGFIKEATATLSLADVSLDWPLAAGPGKPPETLRLRGLATPKPLRAATAHGLGESSLSGSLAFGPLAELPGVGHLSTPLRGLVSVNAAQQGVRSAQFSELLHVDGLALEQNLRLTLDRLDQVLDRDTDRLAAMLENVDGTMGADVRIGLAGGAAPLPGKAARGLSARGTLDAGFDARLAAGRSLALAARLLSPGLDLELGPGLAIKGLTSSLRINKRYALTPRLRCAARAEDIRPPLSEQVFNLFPEAGARHDSGFNGGDALALALPQDFRAGGGSLGFSQLRLTSGPLPLSVHDVFLRVDTGGPLPALRAIRAGLLGGNLLGSALVKGSRGAYRLEADLAFTGIDPSRLFPAKAAKDLGDQAEAAGRVSVSLPLTPDPEILLQRAGLRADITKIGPRTLERMLYALDPEERNESIVQQRRLMGIGYPRFVNLGLDYGSLSLSGEVEVKGFRLALPRIDRLPVGNLPIRPQLSKALAPVPGLIKALDAVSAGNICRDAADPKGRLKVQGTTAQEGVAP